MATTTLRQLNGFDETPATLDDSTLVLVDYQKVYTGGVLELDGWKAAVDSASALLARARQAGTPVVHVVDAGYDLDSEEGEVITELAPVDGEAVVVKSAPNGFHQTDLHERLQASGRTNLILAGFMTHMCVLFTGEGAFLRGYRPTVVSDASGTRALVGAGVELPAHLVHHAALATIEDLYGVVAATGAEIRRGKPGGETTNLA